MKYLSVVFIILISFTSVGYSRGKQKKKVVYKYKKFEKFNFDRFSIEGDSTSPGDISINPRFRVKFKNSS